MLDATPEYRAAIVGDARRMFIKAVIDMISPDIVYGEVTGTEAGAYSRPEQLHDKIFEAERRATLEHNRWLLDGGMSLYPDDPESLTAEVGYQSMALSDSDGLFTPAQQVTLNFSGVSILQACAIYFPGGDDGTARAFTVEIMRGGAAVHTETVEDNLEASVFFEGFTVHDPDGIRVTVTKWSMPRRMRVIEIVPGIYEVWGSDILASLDVQHQINVACTALPYGTATLKMDNLSRRFEPRRKNGLFQSIEDRQAIPIMIGPGLPGGGVEYKPVGVYYQYSGGWKTGDNGTTMTWQLVDIIGLLANRRFEPPEELPTTLAGWLACLAGQLGGGFSSRWRCNAGHADMPVTAARDDIEDLKCGDILRYVCMAAGCYPFADMATGYLSAEPLWSGGGEIKLDDMAAYPVMAANDDLAYIEIKIYGDELGSYRLSGNSTASSNTISVDNPFIHTWEAASAAGRNILACYGGNKITVTGRGDPSSECGDVDKIELDRSTATAARRISQNLSFSGGIMQRLQSVFLQADGSEKYNVRVVLEGDGTWTAPDGVTKLGLILVDGGAGGTSGTNGSWREAGVDGTAGLGGRVLAVNIEIDPGQSFAYSVSPGGELGAEPEGHTVFGSHSAGSGQRYSGYTDIRSGAVYGRNGVAEPVQGSGDGGAAGVGGAKGNRTYDAEEEEWTVSSRPGRGTSGRPGASGCIVIWYERPGGVI